MCWVSHSILSLYHLEIVALLETIVLQFPSDTDWVYCVKLNTNSYINIKKYRTYLVTWWWTITNNSVTTKMQCCTREIEDTVITVLSKNRTISQFFLSKCRNIIKSHSVLSWILYRCDKPNHSSMNINVAHLTFCM